MTGTTFDLKPGHSRSTRLNRSSQLIWAYPNVLMYFIKPSVVPHMCLVHVEGSVHDKLDV